MNIGYDGKFFWKGSPHSSKSGHGVNAVELLVQLMRIDHENRYNIYMIEPDPDLPRQENFREVILPFLSKSSFIRNLVSYPLEVRRNPVDVLMTYTTLPWFVSCKTILLLADIFWIVHPQWLPVRMRVPRTLAARFSVKKADRIVTTTEFSKREIIRHLDVPEEKISIVPLGVRTHFQERVSPETIQRVKAKYGIRGDYVLSINDIHPRKNLDGLAEAFFRLKEQHGIPHQLVFVGRTLWPYPEFFSKIENSKYRDDVVLPGYVASEDINALYQGATLFVYSSFYEGWGLQVHEAMSAQTPVAIAEKTTMSEIAGGAAAEFDPYDIEHMSEVIYKVLDNPALRQEMIQKGLKQVERFSWETSARQTLEICKEVYEQ